MSDPLAAVWCCLACSTKWPLGKAKIYGGIGERSPGNDQGLNCPNCRSMKIHPANGDVRSLESYGGERGTLQ